MQVYLKYFIMEKFKHIQKQSELFRVPITYFQQLSTHGQSYFIYTTTDYSFPKCIILKQILDSLLF